MNEWRQKAAACTEPWMPKSTDKARVDVLILPGGCPKGPWGGGGIFHPAWAPQEPLDLWIKS